MPTQAPVPLPLVLVAHRERDTVDLLKGLLEHEGFTVLCAYTGRAALQYAHQHHPLLLLLDQNLPLLDGLELCRLLRRESDDPAIFLLTDQPDEFGKLLAFSAGADECLALPLHPHELLARAKAVLRRTRVQGQPSQSLVSSGVLELDPDQRQVRAAGRVIALTGLEYELLALLMRAPGRVFSREQLLALLPGFSRSSPLDRAVDIHISNLRRKLREVLGGAVPIEAVRGVGYRLSASESGLPPAALSPSVDPREQLALAAFERVPAPLLVVDRERTVVLYNEAARQLCGWPADQVIGQAKCYSLLRCHDSTGTLLCHEHCALQAGALNRLSDQTAHYSIMLKDGREVPVQAHYSTLGALTDGPGYMLLTLDPETTKAPPS
jgi:two-component system, OmpR family, response regulator RegX3